jgi:hypothetical protein
VEKKVDDSTPGLTDILCGKRLGQEALRRRSWSRWSVITMKTKPWGGRWNRLQPSQAQPLEEKKCRYTFGPFGMNSLKEGAM